MVMPLNRGPYAVDTHTASNRHLKFSQVHDAELVAAAKTLDVPLTTFIKWCAIYGAQQVLKKSYRDDSGNLKEKVDALARTS